MSANARWRDTEHHVLPQRIFRNGGNVILPRWQPVKTELPVIVCLNNVQRIKTLLTVLIKRFHRLHTSVCHGFAITVDHTTGDRSGPRHHQTNIANLLIVCDGDGTASTLVSPLPILGRSQRSAILRGSDAPVTAANLLERKPTIRSSCCGHVLTTGSSTLGFPHFDSCAGHRITRAEDLHDALYRCCSRRQRLLLLLLWEGHVRQDLHWYVVGPDRNCYGRPRRFGRIRRCASSLQKQRSNHE